MLVCLGLHCLRSPSTIFCTSWVAALNADSEISSPWTLQISHAPLSCKTQVALHMGGKNLPCVSSQGGGGEIGVRPCNMDSILGQHLGH